MTTRTQDGSAGDVDYGAIGAGYSSYRRPDERIARFVAQALGDAQTMLNVDAGAGSYENAARHPRPRGRPHLRPRARTGLLAVPLRTRGPRHRGPPLPACSAWSFVDDRVREHFDHSGHARGCRAPRAYPRGLLLVADCTRLPCPARPYTESSRPASSTTSPTRTPPCANGLASPPRWCPGPLPPLGPRGTRRPPRPSLRPRRPPRREQSPRIPEGDGLAPGGVRGRRRSLPGPCRRRRAGQCPLRPP